MMCSRKVNPGAVKRIRKVLAKRKNIEIELKSLVLGCLLQAGVPEDWELDFERMRFVKPKKRAGGRGGLRARAARWKSRLTGLLRRKPEA